MPEFIPAVKAVVVRDDGRVLLLKRAADETHLQERWDVPGGSVDHGETPREAAERETTEEAGIAVDIELPVNTWSYMHDDGGHRVGVTFLCSPDSMEITLGDEHTDYRWASREALRSVDMYDDLRSTLETVLEEYGDLPKLVRDRIPDIIQEDGQEPLTEQVPDADVMQHLADKLVEEAEEFRESKDVEELADLVEIVDRCLREEDTTWRQLQQLRNEKKQERGGFEENIVLRDIED